MADLLRKYTISFITEDDSSLDEPIKAHIVSALNLLSEVAEIEYVGLRLFDPSEDSEEVQ